MTSTSQSIVKPSRILIVKFCCIGDVLFSTPLIRALKKSIPNCYIAYLVGKWSKEVIEDNPNIDEIILWNMSERKNLNLEKIKKISDLILKLRKKKFDTAIILHRSPWVGMLTWIAGIPQRIGFDYKGQGIFLTTKVFFNSSKHEVKRYLEIAQAFGIKDCETSMEMHLSQQDREFVDEILRKEGVKSSDILIASLPGGGVNPGLMMPIKRWPKEKYAKLYDKLIEKFGVKIIITGGESDRQLVNQIIRLMKNKPINMVGKTTLKQTAALLKKSILFIGNDSGPLYMAAAVGTPTIGIFGPSDSKLVAPIGDKHIAIQKIVPCGPCYNPDSVFTGDFSGCKNDLKCMRLITVEEVLVAVDKQMKKILAKENPCNQKL